jgi:hypothetical protein
LYLISRSSSLTMPLRDTQTDYHPVTGAIIRVRPALSVQFQKSGGAPDWARDAVQQLAGFGNGLGHNEDPFSRVGVLDTDDEAARQGWTDEEKEFVEGALLRASSNGSEYVICSAPKIGKPWDKYDEFVGEDAVDKILYTVDLIGADAKSVLRYERENLARESVISALEERVEQDEENVAAVISL